MSTSPMPLRIPIKAIVALWSVPAWLTTLNYLVLVRGTSRAVDLPRVFLAEGVPWYLWVGFTPIIVHLAQRYPLDQRWTFRVVLPHLLASTMAAGLYGVISAYLVRFIRPDAVLTAATLKTWCLGALPIIVVTYIGVLGLCYAWINTRKLWQRDLDAERMALLLREAELSALRMQLQPHFLFNSLNSIMALVRDRETERSVDALGFLGDVLHTTLRPTQAHEVPLGDELAFIRRYLALETIRFADRLRVHIDVPDDLQHALVPVFVLQPLVENALRHGLLPLRAGGELAITAATVGRSMMVTVKDTGSGLAPDWETSTTAGIGLANTRRRLSHLYGSAGQLSIHNQFGRGGVEAIVELPLRYASPEDAG